MPKSRKHDGVVYQTEGTQVWWIRYRDRNGVAPKRVHARPRTGNEANKRLRERLQARDNNVLEVVRKGEALSFGQWADFFLENYSKPPIRAEKTHEANNALRKTSQICVWHEQLDGYHCGSRSNSIFGSVFASASESKLHSASEKEECYQAHHGTPGVSESSGVCSMWQFGRSSWRRTRVRASNFRLRVKGLFRPHYVTWSEQKRSNPTLRSICGTSFGSLRRPVCGFTRN